MSDDQSPVRALTEEESWNFLATRPVGRLATSVAQQPDIFPVNFVLDDGSIVFQTSQGSKLLGLTINEQVAFEVDDWDVNLGGWSVVCRGRAEAIDSSAEFEHAETLDLQPWVSTVKTIYVRIRVEEIIGRAFNFGSETEELIEPED